MRHLIPAGRNISQRMIGMTALTGSFFFADFRAENCKKNIFNMNWKFWIAIIILAAVLFLLINMQKKCKREGDKLGVPYRCKMFSSEPITIIAEEHYYGKREGKCFEFLNYGANMSVCRVPMEKCGEKEPVKKSDIVEDAVYTFND